MCIFLCQPLPFIATAAAVRASIKHSSLVLNKSSSISAAPTQNRTHKEILAQSATH
jgi:hypothetical protein